MMHYIIDSKGNITEEPDLMKWATWLESEQGRHDRRIVETYIGKELRVSTVFLGLDHSFREDQGAPPILFETMTFQTKPVTTEYKGKPWTFHPSYEDEECSGRYVTIEDAKRDHDEMVKAMIGKIRWYCDMCDSIRLDKNIKVYSYPIKDLPGGERNLKYCADNEECFKKAVDKGIAGQI